jgi:hypothetical protein
VSELLEYSCKRAFPAIFWTLYRILKIITPFSKLIKISLIGGRLCSSDEP